MKSLTAGCHVLRTYMKSTCSLCSSNVLLSTWFLNNWGNYVKISMMMDLLLLSILALYFLMLCLHQFLFIQVVIYCSLARYLAVVSHVSMNSLQKFLKRLILSLPVFWSPLILSSEHCRHWTWEQIIRIQHSHFFL